MADRVTPSLNIEELMDRARQEMWSQSNVLARQALPHLGTVALEQVLEEADRWAQPRTKFPTTLNRFPLSASRLAQRAILKLINLLAADQQIISGLLIRSIRQSVDSTAQAFAQARDSLGRLGDALRKHEHTLAWLQDATRALQTRAGTLGGLVEEARNTTDALAQDQARVSQELEEVQRMIRELAQQVGEKGRAHERDEKDGSAERAPARLTDELYAAFEERFRG